jgi:hypothetical protein
MRKLPLENRSSINFNSTEPLRASFTVSAVVVDLVREEGLLFCFYSSWLLALLVATFITDLENLGPMLVPMRFKG